jgi:hypothetical protein
VRTQYLALVVIVVALAGACSTPAPSPAASTVAPSRAARPTATATVEVALPAIANVGSPAFGRGTNGAPAVWLLDDVTNVLYEADPDSGVLLGAYGVGFTGDGSFIAMADDYVWVGSQTNNTVARLVKQDGTVEGLLQLPCPLSAAATADAVWILDCKGTVHGFDAKSLQPRGTVQPGYSGGGLEILAGRVWVSGSLVGGPVTLLRSFDPSTPVLSEAALSEVLRVAGSQDYLSTAAGSLFLSDTKSGQITRVDPATATVAGVYSEPVGSYVVQSATSVPWIFNYKSGDLAPLDLGSGHAGAGINVSPHVGPVIAGVAVWFGATRMALP